MSLPYPGWSVVFGEQPTASKWSELGANDDSLAAGTGFNTGAIPTAALANASVTSSKLSTGAATATVVTGETTTSTSFTALTTAGPSVTVTVGANGLALVGISAQMANNTTNGICIVGFAISGATTLAATSNPTIFHQSAAANVANRFGASYLVTGLTPGSTTFTAQYEVSSNTGTFTNRILSVVPL